MEGTPPPDPEAMKDVFAHLWESVKRAGLPIGVFPEIQVSLVVQPEETADLAPPSFSSKIYEAKLAAIRTLARPYIWWKRRPRAA